MRGVLGRLSGFTLLPLIGLVLPLLLLPTAARIVGLAGWSSALGGTAIGAFASTVILWGWNVDGPVMVARAAGRDRRARIYARSLRTRILLGTVVLPAATIVAMVSALPGYASDAAAMTLATALAGFSPAWFGIGTGNPLLLAAYDTLPRVLGTLASVPLMLWTGSLWPYPLLIAIATLVSLTIFGRRHARGTSWFPRPLRPVLGDMAEQRHTAGYNLAGAAYSATPIPIANATIANATTAPFGSTDQLYRYGLFSVMALGNALQAWTLEPRIPNRARRHALAIGAHVVLGLAGFVILVVAGPPVGSFLFGADKAPTVVLCALYGATFLCISVATPLSRNILIPAGRQRFVLASTILAALVGVVAMLVAGAAGRVEGIALGVALSEAVVLAALVVPAVRLAKENHDG